MIKAVAFTLSGEQIGAASVRNRYEMGRDGSATQSLSQTWDDCAAAIRGLGVKVDNLANRTAAVALTGQGDGTWLVGKDKKPAGDAWIWLDARAAPTVSRLVKGDNERARFEATGTGLNTCQQGTQMAHMQVTCPELLDRSEVALHCKDWLFLNLTSVRATDPSEASFTFGNFRDRRYSDVVISALGLESRRHLLPEIVDGSKQTFPLTADAARQTGLNEGTPVSLGYVDMVMIRANDHGDVEDFADAAGVPVINGLTDRSHPCQLMADALTILEKFGRLENIKVCYLGDCNNVTNSWLNLASRIPLDLRIATSKETLPPEHLVKQVQDAGLSKLSIYHEAAEAVQDAQVLYTDVWASMGEKEKIKEREQLLFGFQINRDLLNLSSPDSLVMHCLPANREREITAEVMDGPRSIVYDQAENRLHAQKAILAQLERWRN